MTVSPADRPVPSAVDPVPGGLLLALHSSGSQLGVGLRRLDGSSPDRIALSAAGRGLVNGLLERVEAVCPAQQWPQLRRLAVAIGPGGFTGTRLTVVLARTLAQQLQVPLDGVGSLLLVARRLAPSGPLWLAQELPRRGLVAGLYGPSATDPALIEERIPPRLHADAAALAALDPAPWQLAEEDVAADVASLLDWATAAQAAGRPSPWQPVLPLYPTSPVDGLAGAG